MDGYKYSGMPSEISCSGAANDKEPYDLQEDQSRGCYRWFFYLGGEVLNVSEPGNDFRRSVKLFFGRYIKNYFGKGPEKIYVSLSPRRITIEMHGFLNEAERKTMSFDGAGQAIEQYRRLLLESLCCRADPIDKELGVSVDAVFVDFTVREDRCKVLIDLAADVT